MAAWFGLAFTAAYIGILDFWRGMVRRSSAAPLIFCPESNGLRALQYNDLLTFVSHVARLTPDANLGGDAVSTLSRLIEEARALTGDAS